MMPRLIQLGIVLMPVVLFGWLLYLDIDPRGEFEVTYEMGDVSPFVDRLLPDQRVSDVYRNGSDRVVSVEGDPTYFSIHAPQTAYETVEVELAFDPGDAPLVEFGPRVDIFSQAYDLQPAYQDLLSSSDWTVLENQDTILWQRDSDFDSVEAFLESDTPRYQIATYHYDFSVPFRPSDYRPLGFERDVEVSLRGFHKYVTYVKDETLALRTTYMDMNRSIGADEVVLRVLNEKDEVVLEDRYKDDGNELDNQISTTREVSFSINSLPEGVYTVELSGTSDIFWRRFQTPQRYMSFVNQLSIGDDVGHTPEPRSTSFVTNAKDFVFETLHADGLQQLRLGSEFVPLTETHTNVYVSVDDQGLVEGYSPVGDVKIVGDGKFAFSVDALFEPDPVSLRARTDLDARNISYVLTTYEDPAVDEDGWLRAATTFNVEEIFDQDGNATFTISFPQVDGFEPVIEVHAIRLLYRKPPLNMLGFLSALRERLPFGL